MVVRRVLIVGSGARKHALAVRLLDEGCQEVWVVPGNPALARLPIREAPIGTRSLPLLAGWARNQAVDLVLVLDEGLLFRGLADALQEAGVVCLGPKRSAAVIERSKSFAKHLMQRAQVPSPQWQLYSNPRAAAVECPHLEFPSVIKADGPVKGQGVFVVGNAKEALRGLRQLDDNELGPAPVLVESFLDGPEFSLTVLADARGDLVLLPLVHEYKLADPTDRSTITTGMGAVAPVEIEDDTVAAVLDNVHSVLRELRQAGLTYTGSLTTNVILGSSGPELLEFNTHMGDPETQTVMPRIGGSLFDILYKVGTDQLGGFVDLHSHSASTSVSLTLVRAGYPGPLQSDIVLPNSLTEHRNLFYYDTYPTEYGLSPQGGRVLSCQASGHTFIEAADLARALAASVVEQIPGLSFRRYIGTVRDAMTL